MDQLKKVQKNLVSNAKISFSNLRIKKFSKDMLDYNKLLENAEKHSGKTMMRAETDAILVNEAVRLKEKYPAEKYDRSFIDKFVEIAKAKQEKILKPISYALAIGACLAATFNFVSMPFILGNELGAAILLSFIAGGGSSALAYIILFNIWDRLISKTDSKWIKTWNVFDIIHTFTKASELTPQNIIIRNYSPKYSSDASSAISSVPNSPPKPIPQKDFPLFGAGNDSYQGGQIKPPSMS